MLEGPFLASSLTGCLHTHTLHCTDSRPSQPTRAHGRQAHTHARARNARTHARTQHTHAHAHAQTHTRTHSSARPCARARRACARRTRAAVGRHLGSGEGAGGGREGGTEGRSGTGTHTHSHTHARPHARTHGRRSTGLARVVSGPLRPASDGLPPSPSQVPARAGGGALGGAAPQPQDGPWLDTMVPGTVEWP